MLSALTRLLVLLSGLLLTAAALLLSTFARLLLILLATLMLATLARLVLLLVSHFSVLHARGYPGFNNAVAGRHVPCPWRGAPVGLIERREPQIN